MHASPIKDFANRGDLTKVDGEDIITVRTGEKITVTQFLGSSRFGKTYEDRLEALRQFTTTNAKFSSLPIAGKLEQWVQKKTENEQIARNQLAGLYDTAMDAFTSGNLALFNKTVNTMVDIAHDAGLGDLGNTSIGHLYKRMKAELLDPKTMATLSKDTFKPWVQSLEFLGCAAGLCQEEIKGNSETIHIRYELRSKPIPTLPLRIPNNV
jgi:hypothetical protein